MLAKRIIPCLDVADGRVVKGVRFKDIRDAGDPLERAIFYDREGADELVFLDITASVEGRRAILEVVRQTAEHVFIPFTVGGGVDDLEFMRQLLQNGADKVSINTAALKRPALIDESAAEFGSQCIMVAVDARREKTTSPDLPQRWEVFSHGGRHPTGLDAVEWAVEAAQRGAGEILLTSMDYDGTQKGYDTEMLAAVVDAVPVPVIASGGAGKIDHLKQALVQGKAHAVLLASLLHYGTYTIAQIKEYLAGQELPVRPARTYDIL